MNQISNPQVIIVSPNQTILSVIDALSDTPEHISNLALVCNEASQLLGVLNHADIIRLLSKGGDVHNPVSEHMVRDPIVCRVNASPREIIEAATKQAYEKNLSKKTITRFIPVLNDSNQIVDVVDTLELLAFNLDSRKNVAIYGMGFVGLTLGVALASRGHRVTGVESKSRLLSQLSEGQPHITEPRLPEMLKACLKDKTLRFVPTEDFTQNQIVIIAVGTPINIDGTTDFTSLLAVCNAVGPRLRKGDLVMLRSTVPVGSTRNTVIPILENTSNLTAGVDFHIAFSPERTVEGAAMSELTTLPQIVGGLTPKCLEKAISFWRSLTDSVISAESLEAAELVKLINNSYRDLSFAFANGFSLLADKYNLDANRIIGIANEGYPRNPIPRPSPGVGGYCLTKDPYLYASFSPTDSYASLSLQARKVNDDAAHYPVSILARYSEKTGQSLSSMNVLIAGFAFKGLPATNDIRGSNSLQVANHLHNLVKSLLIYDSIIDDNSIREHGFEPCTLLDAAPKCDVVLILNNHPDNVPDGLLECLLKKSVLVFDGWNMLDRFEVEKYANLTYACMGYMTL